MANMKISVTSNYAEMPDSGLRIPPEVLEVEVQALHRFSITIPKAENGVLGMKEVYIPAGYHTDPNDLNSFVPYDSTNMKILGVLMPVGSRYSISTSGPSNIDEQNAVVFHSPSYTTEKLIFDSPILVSDQASGLKFSDFFGNEVPFKVDLYNAFEVDNEVEIILGLSL